MRQDFVCHSEERSKPVLSEAEGKNLVFGKQAFFYQRTRIVPNITIRHCRLAGRDRVARRPLADDGQIMAAKCGANRAGNQP